MEVFLPASTRGIIFVYYFSLPEIIIILMQFLLNVAGYSQLDKQWLKERSQMGMGKQAHKCAKQIDWNIYRGCPQKDLPSGFYVINC
jgi:hypothetical protein